MKSDVGGTVRVGLIGFGTVGQAFARLLAREAPDLRSRRGLTLSLVAVANRGVERKRDGSLGAGVDDDGGNNDGRR